MDPSARTLPRDSTGRAEWMVSIRRRPRGLRQGARPDGCILVFLNLFVVANSCSNMLPCLRCHRFSRKITARGRFRGAGGGAGRVKSASEGRAGARVVARLPGTPRDGLGPGGPAGAR